MSIVTDYQNSEAILSFTSETAFTLPSYNSRSSLTVKNLSAPSLTLTAYGSELIDGSATFVLGGLSTAKLVKGEAGWVVVEGSEGSIGGIVTVTNSTEATTAGAGAVVVSGGIFATKAIISDSNTSASSSTTGGIIQNGSSAATSVGIGGGNVNAGGTLTVGGNSTLTGTLGVTAASTFTGGAKLATQPTIYPAAGGLWQLATAGTDSACTNGTSYFVELNVPYNQTLTGLAYQVGSVGGTDKVIVALYNSAGTVVASSAVAGATVGTAAQIQSVAFETPYAAVSGRYFASVTFDGTTAKFRTYPIPGSKFIAGSEAETFGTVTNITPGTTFTADKGPLCYVY